MSVATRWTIGIGIALALAAVLGLWVVRSEPLAEPPDADALLAHFKERMDLSRDRLDSVGHSDKSRVVKELAVEWGCTTALKVPQLLPTVVVGDPVAWLDETGGAHLFAPLYSEEMVLHIGPIPPSSLPN